MIAIALCLAAPPVSGQRSFLAPLDASDPIEVWIAPVDPAVDFCDLTPAARLELGASVRRVFSALHTAFDGAPFNAWLHRLPGTGFHWHLEVQPRTGFLAGLELGGDMYINAVPAIEAAQRLRSALA